VPKKIRKIRDLLDSNLGRGDGTKISADVGMFLCSTNFIGEEFKTPKYVNTD